MSLLPPEVGLSLKRFTQNHNVAKMRTRELARVTGSKVAQ
jgi:hypothetical protein